MTAWCTGVDERGNYLAYRLVGGLAVHLEVVLLKSQVTVDYTAAPLVRAMIRLPRWAWAEVIFYRHALLREAAA